MALFTALDHDSARDVCRVFRLGDLVSVEGIPSGTINSNYRVATSTGSWFVRINEGKTLADVAYESELVAHLAGHGVRTPEPVCGDDGRPFGELALGLVTVFPWCDGGHPELRTLASTTVHAVGEQLARAHLAGLSFPARKESRYSYPRIQGRLEQVRAARRPELADALRLLDEAFALLGGVRYPASYGEAPLPEGVIHGDLFPDNVLIHGPTVVALLDFEQASDGRFVYDLAVCLCAWAFDDDDFDADRARALIRGYQSLRILEPRERQHLWHELVMVATRFTITRLTDVHLNASTTDEVRRAKDYRRYLGRLTRLRAMRADGLEAWFDHPPPA